jgi:hypothetical protein
LTWRVFLAITLSDYRNNDKIKKASPERLYFCQHGAFLFSTSHFAAGLAEWAVMFTMQLRILRGKIAQLQE